MKIKITTTIIRFKKNTLINQDQSRKWLIVQLLKNPKQQLFGILKGSIFRIDLMIMLKGGRNQTAGCKMLVDLPK